MDTQHSVLVIDDNEDALEILRSLLEDKGYRPLLATDGPQGLAIARSEVPDCIVLDIMMPNMSGFRVCEDLRSDPTTERIPIVILTARKVERDKSYARTVGVSEFLTKPVRPSQLLGAIAKQIAGRDARGAGHLGTRRVLVITTDHAFARGLSSSVDAFNFLHKGRNRYDLITAATLKDARTLAHTSNPAAIIVDALAHNEGPAQIVGRLKKDPKHGKLPLLVVRHDKADELRFAWAEARLPGRPTGKIIMATLAQLIEK